MLPVPVGLAIKGPPKRNWAHHRKLVEYVFTVLFPEWTSESAHIAIDLGVSKSTLYEWLAHYKENTEWRPYKTYRSISKRLFTDAEEDAITDYIIAVYIAAGKYFGDDEFRDVATEAWLRKGGQGSPMFSRWFIYLFKKRNRFSSRKAHPKRRTKTDERIKSSFCMRVAQLLRNEPGDHIVNMDESAWRPMPNNLLTWARTGAENVQIRTETDEKMSMTIICAITADRTKLPMTIVVKGKSMKSCEKMGDMSPHRLCHSESGWITSPLFAEYLMWLREFYRDDQKIYLVLDCYSVHRAADMKDLANALNIEFVYVPVGATDELQPLDRYVFGAMKSIARRKWRQMYNSGEYDKMGKVQMGQILQAAWEGISPQVLEKAWEIVDEDTIQYSPELTEPDPEPEEEDESDYWE